ncbi:MAG TPA: decarboxylating 6-phosphogluconate dehydrogenase [Thermoanaerobaculia bacterium]
MQIGMIGLGRMGGNMVRRLLRGGHECVVFDLNPKAVADLAAEGAAGSGSLDEFVSLLKPPRTAWIMVPAGEPTEGMVRSLGERMEAGDVVIDGGNSHFKDDVRRAQALQEKGIHYVDAGTSGGVWGLERGYCLMIGGEPEVVQRLAPIWTTLSPGRGDVSPAPGREGRRSTAEEGWLHCGSAGAGHFVKMVHNGIEYGLMQAYAEGFDVFRNSAYGLDLADIAELWRRGSVVTSWLLDLTASALAESPDLSEYTGHVQDSGEGRWTVTAAIEQGVPVPVLSSSLFARFRSQQEHTFGEKVLSAMRHKFGGHVEPKK